MDNAIYQRLITKFKRPDTHNENKIKHDYITKVADQIKYVFGKALKTKDIAALRLLASGFNRDVYDFFSRTNNTLDYVRKVNDEVISELVKRRFSFLDTKKSIISTDINYEQIKALQEFIPELKNFKHIYEKAKNFCGVNVSDLHDIYIDPKIITDHQQALMLAMGLRVNRHLNDFSPDVIENPVIRLLYRNYCSVGRGTHDSLTPNISDADYAKRLPSDYLGIEHLALPYFKSFDDIKSHVSLEGLISEAMASKDIYQYKFPDRELHVKKLTSSNSLVVTCRQYLAHIGEHIPNLEEKKNGDIGWLSTKFKTGGHNFLTFLVEDARLTRETLNHVDKLCFVLAKNLPAVLEKVTPYELISPLEKLFSRRQYPYAPMWGSIEKNLVKLCCIDMELKGIAYLTCKLLHSFDSANERASHLNWIRDKLPLPTLSYALENELINGDDIRRLVRIDDVLNDNFYRANPRFAISSVAKLMGVAERNLPNIIGSHSHNEKLLEQIKRIEQAASLTGLYEKEFSLSYYGNASAQIAEACKASSGADMSFLNKQGPSL